MNKNPLLLKGLEEFNNREFFAAHETLEVYWNTVSGDEKELVQSIIQTAVAYYHFGRGNYVGARKLLARAVARAESVDSNTLGIEVSTYLEAIRMSLRGVDDEKESIEMATISFST
ncbi:MAG: DUF309 domain-containing protein [Candidatus Obscuribacterales bacterium]|nr:DUF309 domain-containing protein [Candidatus Obscuribacterales bacterium]